MAKIAFRKQILPKKFLKNQKLLKVFNVRKKIKKLYVNKLRENAFGRKQIDFKVEKRWITTHFLLSSFLL